MSSHKGLENELVRKYGGGTSASELKAAQAQKMFTHAASYAKSWAKDGGYSVKEKPDRKAIEVLVTPKDADTSYRMVIEATTHHCLFQTSWSKNLSESAHPAFTVLATVFNNKLTSKLIMLDFDVRDGEVRLRCALPVGVMAKDPSTMVRKYIEMLRLANTTLLGVIAAEEAWLETPIEAGTEMAKGMDVVLAMFLKKQAES